jgi:sugar phosphate isomerase/epimerase
MIVLSTGSLFTYGTLRAARLAAAAGFDGLELMVDDRWDTRDPAYLSTLARDVPLPIVAVHAPSRPGLMGWGGDEVERVRRSVELAVAVGARTVVVHPPIRYRWLAIRRPPFFSISVLTPFPRRSRYHAWLEDELLAYQATTGVTIAVENMPRHPVAGSWSVNLFDLAHLRDLRRFPAVAFDTTHIGTWNADLLVAYERVADRVAHVHLSDYNGEQHRLPGEGRLPLAPFLAALRGRGFRGAVAVELVPEALGAGNDTVVAERLERALRFCRENFE